MVRNIEACATEATWTCCPQRLEASPRGGKYVYSVGIRTSCPAVDVLYHAVTDEKLRDRWSGTIAVSLMSQGQGETTPARIWA